MRTKGGTIIGKRMILAMAIAACSACSSVAPHTIAQDYTKKMVRLVALLPVENKTIDTTAARIVRKKMLDELYYKGYPKIPLEVIDAQVPKSGHLKEQTDVSARSLGAALKVDAVMQCTLRESETSIHLLYSSTVCAIACELRSVKTGEMLWQSRYAVTKRNLGYSRTDVQRKAAQVYEDAIRETVNKVMDTVPDGPDLTG